MEQPSTDLSPEGFLARIQEQKRVFLLILGPLLLAVSLTHALIRWQSGLKLAAVFGLFLIGAALVSIPLAWWRKITFASHLLVAAAFFSTSLNQYALASGSIGPVLNIFSIFMAAVYLLSPRWGLFYGLLSFCRAVALKALFDTGVLTATTTAVPVSDWYTALAAAFFIFAYLLIALVNNYRLLLDSYRDAAAARQKFLARLSHEIRTPLNALLGIGEILNARIVDPEKQKYMATILNAGQSMLQIANQALEVSRLEGQKISGSSGYDARALTRQLASLFEAEARRKNLIVEVYVDAAVPERVAGDAVAVREIVTNFLHNALKFTTQGAIRISLTCEDADVPWLVYSVSDTGRGISADKIRTIFEPFDQGGVPTVAAEGVGLGLAICHELSLQMGANVSAESHEGNGSVFRLRIPLRVETGGIRDAKPAELRPIAPVVSGKKKILSVDDDAMNQMLIRAYLDLPEIRLTTVDSAEKAIAASAAEDYDLILMDLNMPGIDGIEGLNRIRALERGAGKKAVPVIAVTASVMPEEIARVQQAGFSFSLSKPLTQEDLFRAISTVLE